MTEDNVRDIRSSVQAQGGHSGRGRDANGGDVNDNCDSDKNKTKMRGLWDGGDAVAVAVVGP